MDQSSRPKPLMDMRTTHLTAMTIVVTSKLTRAITKVESCFPSVTDGRLELIVRSAHNLWKKDQDESVGLQPIYAETLLPSFFYIAMEKIETSCVYDSP